MELSKTVPSSQQVAIGGVDRSTKKPKAQVLDEDEYLTKLELIIQRDFFPDIEKLKAQSEYFDAVRSNDVEKIKHLQEKFSSRRTDKPVNTPRSPAYFETPDVRKADEDKPTVVENEAPTPSTSTGPVKKPQEGTSNVDDVKLDKFLYKYTSEDNSSFDEIMDEAERKVAQKHAWMFDAEREHDERIRQTLAIRAADEQLFIEGPKGPRTAGVDNWTYRAKNTVMFHPPGVEWSSDELMDRQKMHERVIMHENTRLDPNVLKRVDASAEAIGSKAATIHAAISRGKVDALGNEIGALPANQWSYVVTPSPMPGVADSPMMTWGEIEGTPFLLDASDTMVPKTPGTTFKMPEVPLRDQLAQSITADIAKKHRQQKQEAMRQLVVRTPTNKFGSTKSMERLASMSPAAQRLATTKLGIRVGTDKALKATYTPSPMRATSTTPVVISSGTPSTSKRVSELNEDESLTDNLLNLQAKKPKAADYF